MEHYVTLFDSLFLPQGLALHASMQRHAGAHTLWVLCLDDECHRVLRGLELPNLRLLRLSDVETDELRAVKPGRSRAEYCWTLTPWTPRFVFEADAAVERVTYVDADVWLCRNPEEIFREFEASGKSVLITEHAYAPEYDMAAETGRFCVQFMTFVRQQGEVVRTWWAERCIEWCFARIEDGKFGDQKYLDDWPSRFRDHVHVLRQRELTQAPWNSARFAPSEAAVFHFHQLRLLSRGHVLLSESYSLHRSVRRTIYQPYLRDLEAAVQLLARFGFVAAPQMRDHPTWVLWRAWARRLARALRIALSPAVVRR